MFHLQAHERTSSSCSDELTERLKRMEIAEETYLPSSDPSSDNCSTASSSSDKIEPSSSSSDTARRQKLNVFLEECGIVPLHKPWREWQNVTERTRERYLQQTSEIVSSVIGVISPKNATRLWEALQSSNIVNNILGVRQVGHPSEVAYLKALAEAYKRASGWDTRRQVLSIMAGIASFKAISEFIPGLTQYRFTEAKLHGLQHGRGAIVPEMKSPHIRIERQKLDHFLSFVTSPHLVQDMPFGEKHLQLSDGTMLTVPNVIRTMIPSRIVSQYKRFCVDSGFKPFNNSMMLRILSECSASVRKSLQGLDYVAAEGSRAFDTLEDIVEKVSHMTDGGKKWAEELQETLKAGKLYLKGDYKVTLYMSPRLGLDRIELLFALLKLEPVFFMTKTT